MKITESRLRNIIRGELLKKEGNLEEAAGVASMAAGAAVGASVGSFVPGVGTVLGAVVGAAVGPWLVDWLEDAGDMGGQEKYDLALNVNTWRDIKKALNKVSIETQQDVMEHVDVMSEDEAADIAQELDDAMRGMGTTDKVIRSFVNKFGSVMDFARVSSKFGSRKGKDLNGWLKGDVSKANRNQFIIAPLAKKPVIVYKRKQYDSGEEFLKAVAEDVKPEKKEGGDREKMWKGKECVIKTAEENDGKWSEDSQQVTISIGDAMARFGSGGSFAYKGPDYKDGASVLKGKFQCKGDDLDLGGDLDLSEGRRLTPRLIRRIKNRLLSEEIKFGTIVLPVPEEKEVEEEEVEKKTTTWTDEPASPPFRAGHMGKKVEKIQKAVGSGVDGKFGGGTKRQVKAWQKLNGLSVTGIIDEESWSKITKGGGRVPHGGQSAADMSRDDRRKFADEVDDEQRDVKRTKRDQKRFDRRERQDTRREEKRTRREEREDSVDESTRLGRYDLRRIISGQVKKLR